MGDVPTPGMRWVGALVEAAKTVWYLFLRKSRLVEPVFTGTRPNPGVERGNAHVRRQERRRPTEDPLFASEEPVLRVLRQRAALELFEWLGLDEVPKSYWTLLERVGDPSRALIAFISDSHFDSMRVRRRDTMELAAFRNFVRFVCQVEELTDAVSARQRTLLDRHTHYGEHAIARSLLDLFVTLNEAMELCERSTGPYRFAAFTKLARRVSKLRENAARTDLRAAKALLETSRRYARLTWRFRNAAERKERLEAAAGKRWATLSLRDQAIWAGVLSDLAQTQSALMGSAECDAHEEVKNFEERVERLAALLEEVASRERDAAGARRAAEERRRREAHARAREDARRQQEQRTRENERRGQSEFKGREAHGLSQDELLAIFAFPPGALPDLSALRRAFIREASKTHPVSGQPDYRERNDRYRLLKDAYERLKMAFG